MDRSGYLQTAYGDGDPMFVEALRTKNEKIKMPEEKDRIITTQKERISKLEQAVALLSEKEH